MTEIKHEIDYRNWTTSRKNKNSNTEVSVLTTRMSLRIYPLINFFENEDDCSNLMRISNRTNSLVWPITQYKGEVKNLVLNSIVDAAAIAAIAASDAVITAHKVAASDLATSIGLVATSAAIVAHNAVASEALDANGTDNTTRASDHTAHAMRLLYANTVSEDNSSSAGAIGAEIAWSELSHDINLLEKGTTPELLSFTSLWNNGTPDRIIQQWHKLKHRLLNDSVFKDQHWEVWTRWYDDRLNGRTANMPFEIARSSLPAEFWELDVAEINSQILALEAEHTPPPSQISGALTFKVSGDGEILFSDTPRNVKHDVSEDAKERYQEVHDNTSELLEIIRSRPGMSNDPSLGQIVTRLLDALGTDFTQLNLNRLFSRGDRLRRRDRIQKQFEANPAFDSDFAKLADDIADSLDELVKSYNLMVGLDPELARCDEVQLGPDEKVSADEDLVDKLSQVQSEIADQDFISDEAKESLEEEISTALEYPDNPRLLIRAWTGCKNIVRAIGGFLWKLSKPAAKVAAVPAAAYIFTLDEENKIRKAFEWMIKADEPIDKWFADEPWIHSFVDWLKFCKESNNQQKPKDEDSE